MTARHPYYELRLYEMLPMRITEFHDLLGRDVPPIFAKCGIAKPLGFWESYAGPLSPLFAYLIPWESVDARMAAWARFYADPEWVEKLATNYAGQQRVERANVHILRPSALWDRFPSAVPRRPMHGIHELRVYRCHASHDGCETESWLADSVLPALAGHGMELMGAFAGCIGMPTDSVVLFFAWPDEDLMRHAHREFEMRPGRSRQPARADCVLAHVMRPIGYGIPFSGFTES